MSNEAEQAPSPPSEAPPRSKGAAPSPATRPYRLLDAWRGVAAIWVVLLHSRGPGLPFPLDRFSLLGLLGVPMFFVISGYCIASAALRSADSPRPVAHFLKARVRRIYPPYFFASLVTILSATLLASLSGHHLLNFLHRGPRYYLGALTLTQPLLHVDYILPIFWSLCYEAAFYLIVAALLLLARWTNQTPRLLDALGAVTLGILFWLTLVGPACPFPWNRWPQFGLGILVYQILAQPERRGPRLVFLASVALMLAWTTRQGSSHLLNVAAIEAQSLFCLPFALLLILLFRWDGALTRCRPVHLLSWFGLFSYSLYLSHYIALRIVVQGASRVPFLASHSLLLFLVKSVVCIGGGWLFFQFCERPFLNTRQRQVEQIVVEPAAP